MTKNLVADMVTGSLLSSSHHIYTLQLTADRSGNPGADLAEISEGGGQVQESQARQSHSNLEIIIQHCKS